MSATMAANITSRLSNGQVNVTYKTCKRFALFRKLKKGIFNICIKFKIIHSAMAVKYTCFQSCNILYFNFRTWNIILFLRFTNPQKTKI